MLKSHFQLKVKDQYQISNYPCPFSVFWEDDGIEPIPHAELWAAVPLELVSISTLDPKLFEPLTAATRPCFLTQKTLRIG